jgi:hypothetical protein
MQDLHIDVVLFSETHLKPHERFHIQNYHFYRIDHHQGRKGGTAVAVRKGIPHSHVDLPPFISVEAVGVCTPIGNKDILLAAVYKSPGRTWSDADIAELLSLRDKCILAGDLNAKHLSWNSAVSKPSGEKLLQYFIEIASKFLHHSDQPITPRGEMEMYWILWCIRISESQMSLYLIFWIQITYRYYSTSWIKLERKTPRHHLRSLQTGSGFKA